MFPNMSSCEVTWYVCSLIIFCFVFFIAPGQHTSTSSTGGGDSTHPTPVHSRSSSKDLTAFVDPSPVFSDSKQLLVRSDSHDKQTTHSDVSPETTHSDVSPDRPHVEPPLKQSHLSAKGTVVVT